MVTFVWRKKKKWSETSINEPDHQLPPGSKFAKPEECLKLLHINKHSRIQQPWNCSMGDSGKTPGYSYEEVSYTMNFHLFNKILWLRRSTKISTGLPQSDLLLKSFSVHSSQQRTLQWNLQGWQKLFENCKLPILILLKQSRWLKLQHCCITNYAQTSY